MMHILILGDGNFSFSLAYLKSIASNTNRNIQLTATSYDSIDELYLKYPETKNILLQLQALGVTIYHRIDATNIYNSLLIAYTKSNHSQLDIKEDFIPKYDLVIFNHPHCGEENLQRHQSLLSHFFHSTQEIIAKPHGKIAIMLAQGQSDRWEVYKRALQAGWYLLDEKLEEEVYGELNYTRKRHQNGSSFHQVMLHGQKIKQQSNVLTFTIDCTIIKSNANRRKEDVSFKEDRKVMDKTEYNCEMCDRSFTSKQGLKTHVHMVHTLKTVGNQASSKYNCKVCQRAFQQEDALRQHMLAKHGNDQLIQPDWYLASQEKSLNTSTDCIYKCDICNFQFPTHDILQNHWEELQPVPTIDCHEKKQCKYCTRSFFDERALRQHRNFCNGATIKQSN